MERLFSSVFLTICLWLIANLSNVRTAQQSSPMGQLIYSIESIEFVNAQK